jgi:hypothetical protein
VPSARFERATFRLGGERSIQLSYKSKTILDFRFAICDCPILIVIAEKFYSRKKAQKPQKKSFCEFCAFLRLLIFEFMNRISKSN